MFRAFDVAANAQPSAVPCSAGTLRIPILYQDGSMLALLYRVDPAAAAALVPGELVEPLTLGRHAFAALMAFEYRRTTIGPYNELALSVYVRRRGAPASTLGAVLAPARSPDAGGWVVVLPVTTEVACAGGKEVWGYPKYVTRIETEFAPDHTRVVLGGELVLEHTVGRGLRLPGFPLVTFTRSGERLLRTHAPVGHCVRYGGARSVRLRVTGPGPTADAVRRLGLDARRPMFAFRTDQLRAALPLGHARDREHRTVDASSSQASRRRSPRPPPPPGSSRRTCTSAG